MGRSSGLRLGTFLTIAFHHKDLEQGHFTWRRNYDQLNQEKGEHIVT